MGTSKLLPDTKYMDKADNLDFAAAFARIECHYFVNKIFLEEAFIPGATSEAVRPSELFPRQPKADARLYPAGCWLVRCMIVMSFYDATHSLCRVRHAMQYRELGRRG